MFALSNAGSLLALLSYPFLVEVYWGSAAQAFVWSVGFVCFAVACPYLAVQTYRARTAAAPAERIMIRSAGQDVAPPTWPDRTLWLLLPTLASVMFLAVTNEVCQNVTTVPLLWIVPLSLYLVTFIIAFDHPRWYWRPAFLVAAIVSLLLIIHYDDVLPAADGWLNFLLGRSDDQEIDLAGSWALQSCVYFAGFFFVAMVGHGELAVRRPPQQHLTSYYLTMSLGGAVGGILINLVAPQVFTTFFEFPLGLFVSLAAMCLLACSQASLFPSAGRRPVMLGVVLAVVLFAQWQVFGLGIFQRPSTSQTLHQSRNFFGVVSVRRRSEGDPKENLVFNSGTIPHGKQLADPARRRLPLTYYGEGSGVARAIEYAQRNSPNCNLGVVGLGIGTLAAYARPGDTVRFYEINPEVVKIARNTEWFHFLDDCQGHVDVVLGNARLQLERELKDAGPHRFDVLCIDAFSGDAIPSHLITSEAIQLYKQHLRPDGIIAMHITNTHLDLYPVVKRLAEEHGLVHTRIYQTGDAHPLYSRNYYVLLSNDRSFLERTPEEIVDLPESFSSDAAVPLWTDEFHNVWQLLR